MSTKINVRSPFYLHLTEPTVPLPTYDCTTANLIGFSVDNQGVVTLPNADYGIVHSYTSTAGDFADGKFATVSSDTVRTIDVTIRIPSGFTNTEDVYFCMKCHDYIDNIGIYVDTNSHSSHLLDPLYVNDENVEAMREFYKNIGVMESIDWPSLVNCQPPRMQKELEELGEDFEK